MYEYHNHVLSIPARLLYEDWGLMSYDAYLHKCKRGRLVRTKEGRGPGNEAYISYPDLPVELKALAKAKLGDPAEVAVKNRLLDYIQPDPDASRFFASHRRPNGKPLDFETQVERTTNCLILNAIKTVLSDRKISERVFSKKRALIWSNISDAVNAIKPKSEDPENGYTHSLPGNWRRLKQKYEAYMSGGYGIFISSMEGNDNKTKIKDEVADFILAQYSLPIKVSVPQLMGRYNQERLDRGWPELSESAVARWLYLPEQERIWTIMRDGKDAWRRKFGNSIKRDKSNWYPNVYWAIDGSKLDWIHYDDTSATKRAGKLKINPLVDVYSEKILGWSFSETESHVDHIKAVSMALNNSQTRPYLITYDQQSGHKMARMQELYSSVVAINGGTHYPHQAGRKSNPMEQLFNRLQQQVANMWWWSDKQSIKVRTDRNRMNQEFIAENTHNLHTREQLERAWELTVRQWNESEHPLFKGQTRSQVYEHEMAMREEISPLEIATAVWVDQTNPVTYKRDGITIRIAGEKHTFEVYDHNNDIDLDFRRTGVGRKYVVRYNPEYLDSYVQLYEVTDDSSLVFAACAQPKRTHETVPVLMQPGAKERFLRDFETDKAEFERDRLQAIEIARRAGVTRETMIEEQELMLKTASILPKRVREMAESANDYDF